MDESLDISVFFKGETGEFFSREDILQITSEISFSYNGRSCEIEIVCDFLGEYMRDVHEKYKGERKDTDVLSFPLEEDLGQIVISIPYCEKYHRSKEELKRVFQHGILHILGYDHNTDEEEEEMNVAERRFFIN